jgi:hypothetical protein
MIKLGTEHPEEVGVTSDMERAEAFRVKKFKKVQFKIEHFKPNIAIDSLDIKIRF